MTKREADYLGRLARLGCIACRALYAEYEAPDASLQLTVIHHPRTGAGGGRRSGNWLGIPLCVPHHTGKEGVHANGNFIPALKMHEMDLLDLTIQTYQETYGV